MTQDDLAPWQDTPLVQALTSAASADELAGQGVALAAFRASTSARRRRGVVRFLGTGATSVALLGVVGGGVAAAAYTRSLPSPVQSFAHDVFGPIGVPAPVHHKSHKRHGGTLAAGTTHASPPPSLVPAAGVVPGNSPTPQPSADPSTAPDDAVGKHPVVEATPSLSASALPSVSASATPTPSPTGPAGDPSTWTISATASGQVVPVHGDVQVNGTLLDADGQPVADHRVVVRSHVPGITGWDRAAIRRTDSNGHVDASLDDLRDNRVVVLGAGNGVHSDPLRIVVKPALSVSESPSADGTSYIVTVSADGGDPGDMLTLLRRSPSGWTQIGQAQLDASSSASFSVPVPDRRQAYVVRLHATRQHGAADTRFVLRPNA